MYALNASTGIKLWSYATGTYGTSSPAVANGVVYVGSGYDDNNKIYALNASTGVLLWSYATGSFQAYSSPAVVNGVVYVGSADGKVFALNASTGSLLWSYLKNPQRIQPRNLFDLSVGHDNLFHGEKYKVSLQLTVINLTNKYALYNFLSTFSGTHYVTPRTITAQLGFHF